MTRDSWYDLPEATRARLLEGRRRNRALRKLRTAGRRARDGPRREYVSLSKVPAHYRDRLRWVMKARHALKTVRGGRPVPANMRKVLCSLIDEEARRLGVALGDYPDVRDALGLAVD